MTHEQIIETTHYPTLEEIVLPRRGLHPLWTACRYIERNPGCKTSDLRGHLEATYPIGPRGRFIWILSWTGTRRYAAYSAEMGLYERLYRSDGKRDRGLHLLPRGREVAALEEPSFTPDRPRTMPNDWVAGDLTPGTMLVSRSRKRGIYVVTQDGKRSMTLQPGGFVLFHTVKSIETCDDRRSLRIYGRPYLHAYLEVLHEGTLCVVDASLVKPLWGKGGKRADR